MTFAIKTIGRFLRGFRRKEDGGPTVEFALIFMPFMILSVSGFELGLLMTRHVMLERGLAMAVRELGMNTSSQPDADQFKAMVCNGAGILDDCTTQVRLQMNAIDMYVAGSVNIPRAASCVDESDPRDLTEHDLGKPNQMMVVRACGRFAPMLPEFGLGYFLSRMSESDGYYRLVSTTAFVMEPL